MSRTFRDTEDTDLAIVTSANYWGETCTFIPKGGEARSIVANVEERTEPVDGPDGVMLVRTVTVMCRRSSTLGIENPKLGDALFRERDHLDDGAPDPLKAVSFVSEDQGESTYTFSRQSPFEVGGNRR
jgi:hypothetical protein